jgi:catechol 2,3-dioxygenase-like lactoylglutathione lyase family enzyme
VTRRYSPARALAYTRFMTLRSAIPAIPVSDITRAIAFYDRKLGFELRHIDDDYAIVKRDAVEIHLWIVAKAPTRTAVPALVGSASCKIHVSDLAGLYEEYQTQGVVHPDGALRSQSGGIDDFTVLDVDGNALQFFEVSSGP